MARTRVRRRGAAVAATLVAVALGASGRMVLADQAGLGDRDYAVRPGDTLWTIARGVVGEGEDPRPLVYAIADVNEVDPGRLVPGQTLVIPPAP